MMEKATTTVVAQAISRAVDEHQEFGKYGHDDRMGLYLDDGYGMEGTDLRVVEVSADLYNSKILPMSRFTVKTSDGQEWAVMVTPADGVLPV